MENLPTDIQTRIALVQAEIAAACQRVNRRPESVTLVAVSKTFPATYVVEAIKAGLRDFGENRLEEAIRKMPQVATLTDVPIQWHMIGHLQSRKIRYLAGFSLLHSLDSLRLAERINTMLVEQGKTLDVLLEINVSGEVTKEGWHAQHWRHDLEQRQTLWNDIRGVLALPALNARGLMTMAPIVENPEEARPVFIALRDLRDALVNDFPGATWADLSMGMSDDYPVAIEEGATLVRVGRAIFGSRA